MDKRHEPAFFRRGNMNGQYSCKTLSHTSNQGYAN